MKQAEKHISDKINTIKYGKQTRTWDVSDEITIAWKGVLPLPPANNGATTKKELAYLSKLTSNRTTEQENLIKLIDKEPLDLYYQVLKKYNLKCQKRFLTKRGLRLGPW